MPLIEQTTREETLDAGQSMTLTVGSTRADEIIMLVDDGTTDGPPAQYDLVQRGRVGPADRMQRIRAVAGSTATSRVDQAIGTEFQIELSNASAGAQTFEVTLESRRHG